MVVVPPQILFDRIDWRDNDFKCTRNNVLFYLFIVFRL